MIIDYNPSDEDDNTEVKELKYGSVEVSSISKDLEFSIKFDYPPTTMDDIQQFLRV
jgi:hypothetical protein